MNGSVGLGVVWIVGALIKFRVGEPHGVNVSIVLLTCSWKLSQSDRLFQRGSLVLVCPEMLVEQRIPRSCYPCSLDRGPSAIWCHTGYIQRTVLEQIAQREPIQRLSTRMYVLRSVSALHTPSQLSHPEGA